MKRSALAYLVEEWEPWTQWRSSRHEEAPMALRAAILLTILLGACGPAVLGMGDAGDDGKGDVMCANPGETRSCYSGAPGTQSVGPCTGGTQTCSTTGSWGDCLGEVVPSQELCSNSVDDNCSGEADENVDTDGDGFTTCGGDCCDSTAEGCGSPALVNAGAFEAMGNQIDDDCDGMVDNVAAANCDTGLASNSATALDYAKAMELCQTATMTDQKWGVITARLVLPSGTGTPNANQRSIRPAFGGTTVRSGASFAVLSTGHAAATGQTNPSFNAFQTAGALGGSSTVPTDWYAANNNTIPNAPGCPPPQGGATINDPIMLELTIRAPTNAKSFKLSTNFLSSEFPEWTCSPYNDFFVVLLDSTWAGQPANPTDKNLAIYTSPAMARYPVGVNLANGNTGLFTVCKNGATGCGGGATTGTITTCMATTELVGTGMDPVNPAPNALAASDPGYCGANNQVGGGTGWLVTSGNVKGGEVIKLRIALWDTSDGIYDSVSILDNFQWSVDAAQPGTVIF